MAKCTVDPVEHHQNRKTSMDKGSMQRYSSLLQQKIEDTKGIQMKLLLIFQV